MSRRHRIGYVIPSSAMAVDSIRHRVHDRLRAWSRMGYDALLITGSMSRGAQSISGRAVHEWRDDTHLRRTANELVGQGEIDVVHFRHYAQSAKWSLLSREVPLVPEVHTRLARPERPLDAPRVAWAMANWHPLRTHLSGGVFVTAELATESKHRSRQPSISIGNGIDLPAETAPPPDLRGQPVVAMAVSSLASWHGLDRFAQAARSLAGQVSCRVIAPINIARRMKNQDWARGLDIVGTECHDDYLAELSHADVGLGTLGLDRRGLTEAAPLKVRDYAALGLPCALPYVDTNLSVSSDPCVAQIEWGPEFADRLGAFVADTRGLRLEPQTRALVDIHNVEATRLEYLDCLRK